MAEVNQTANVSDMRVVYTLFQEGQLIVVENVPARVDMETGEQFFAPAIVEQLQTIIWSGRRPKRIIQAPVYEFAG